MDNVTEIFDREDRLQDAFIELTYVMQEFQERFGLSDVELATAARDYTRYCDDYRYYSINGLWEEAEDAD